MADSSLFDTGKAARFTQQMDDVVISDRAYNATIGGVVLWGILVNVFMCLFCVNAIMAISPIALLIGYFVCAFGGTWIVRASHHPIVSFVGYNLVVLPFGALLSLIVTVYARVYGSYIIAEAFGMTAAVVVIMLCLGALFPQFFLRMGPALAVTLLLLIIVEGICSIFSLSTSGFALIGCALFSLYIAYDWVRANSYVHTLDNAVDSACDIYMDIINLFLRILQILGRSSRRN